MITLDDFLVQSRENKGFTLIRILNDLPPIVWDIKGEIKELKFRQNDITHVPDRLASILIKRGSAEKISIPGKVIS